MTERNREPGWLFPAVLLACALGFGWALSEAYAATEFPLPRRAAFLQVTEIVFAAAFILAADTTGRPPWLRISAVAACIGWVLILASFWVR